jgi:hypothetical protein
MKLIGVSGVTILQPMPTFTQEANDQIMMMMMIELKTQNICQIGVLM